MLASTEKRWLLAAMGKTPLQPQDKYVLRLPDGMRDRIKAAADANNRSMNAEIVATLEEKYPEDSFDLGTFLTDLSKSLRGYLTNEEIEKKVSRANVVLDNNLSEWRVQIVMKNGEPHVIIQSAAEIGGKHK